MNRFWGFPKKGNQLGWMAYFRNEPVLGGFLKKGNQLGWMAYFRNEPVLGGFPKKGNQLGWMAYFRNEPVLGIREQRTPNRMDGLFSGHSVSRSLPMAPARVFGVEMSKRSRAFPWGPAMASLGLRGTLVWGWFKGRLSENHSPNWSRPMRGALFRRLCGLHVKDLPRCLHVLACPLAFVLLAPMSAPLKRGGPFF